MGTFHIYIQFHVKQSKIKNVSGKRFAVCVLKFKYFCVYMGLSSTVQHLNEVLPFARVQQKVQKCVSCLFAF